jgi:hypothetical protein
MDGISMQVRVDLAPLARLLIFSLGLELRPHEARQHVERDGSIQ